MKKFNFIIALVFLGILSIQLSTAESPVPATLFTFNLQDGSFKEIQNWQQTLERVKEADEYSKLKSPKQPSGLWEKTRHTLQNFFDPPKGYSAYCLARHFKEQNILGQLKILLNASSNKPQDLVKAIQSLKNPHSRTSPRKGKKLLSQESVKKLLVTKKQKLVRIFAILEPLRKTLGEQSFQEYADKEHENWLEKRTRLLKVVGALFAAGITIHAVETWHKNKKNELSRDIETIKSLDISDTKKQKLLKNRNDFLVRHFPNWMRKHFLRYNLQAEIDIAQSNYQH